MTMIGLRMVWADAVSSVTHLNMSVDKNITSLVCEINTCTPVMQENKGRKIRSSKQVPPNSGDGMKTTDENSIKIEKKNSLYVTLSFHSALGVSIAEWGAWPP